MKRIFPFLTLAVILLTSLSLRAQTPKIDLIVFQDLNTIDFAAFAFTNNLNGAPRIFQVVITPEGRNVVVVGKIDWKQDERTGFAELVHFTTEPFQSRSFYNDELGNSNLRIASVDGNKDLAKKNVDKGKPTGVYGITLQLFDDRGNFLSDTYKELSFLNPAPTIAILSPQENSSYDVGNVQAQWTPVQGATSYKVRANVIASNSQSVEDALNAGNPIINDKDVGKTEIVNLGSILDRQWVGGQRIVLAITAFISGPGGGSSLRSLPVTFRLSESGHNTTQVINPDLIRLANLISGQVSQEFSFKLINGQIPVEQIQITDEKNQTISFTDFLNILAYLEAHRESIISINFTAK